MNSPEGDLQKAIVDAAVLHRWRVSYVYKSTRNGRHHTAQGGSPGLPDLTLARDGIILLIECKADDAHYQPGQKEWIEAAGKYGAFVKPRDLDTMIQFLARGTEWWQTGPGMPGLREMLDAYLPQKRLAHL